MSDAEELEDKVQRNFYKRKIVSTAEVEVIEDDIDTDVYKGMEVKYRPPTGRGKIQPTKHKAEVVVEGKGYHQEIQDEFSNNKLGKDKLINLDDLNAGRKVVIRPPTNVTEVEEIIKGTDAADKNLNKTQNMKQDKNNRGPIIPNKGTVVLREEGQD